MCPSDTAGTNSGTGGAGGLLTIDLDAIGANWRALRDRLAPGATCGAVVKADAYGLGLGPVSKALWRAGCRTFFVALADEGAALRAALPEAAICVFAGADAASAPMLVAHALVPALNHPGQLADWRTAAAKAGRKLPAVLHVDTGMTRLGFDMGDLDAVVADATLTEGLELFAVMSHLACADTPAHPMNAEQLARFNKARARLTPLGARRASLANSSAIFLGPDYHFDLARPGSALFGVAPARRTPNPMAQVVRLQGKILQCRRIDTPRSVGYGATHQAEAGRVIATVAAGYADGYLRALSGAAHAHVGEKKVPVVGRVSMDLITLDVTDVPAGEAAPGAMVDLIGPHHGLDDLADEAGTIGYEILTALGSRYARRYVGAGA